MNLFMIFLQRERDFASVIVKGSSVWLFIFSGFVFVLCSVYEKVPFHMQCERLGLQSESNRIRRCQMLKRNVHKSKCSKATSEK